MKQGFTLIELLAVIVILAIIALISTPLILNTIAEAKKGAFKDTAYGIIKSAELEYTLLILDGNREQMSFTYNDGVETSNIEGKTLKYKGIKPKNGTVIVDTNGQVAIAIYDGSICVEKGYTDSVVSISTKPEAECILEEPVVTYTYYDEAKGINKPQLATGMTPIKWNGTTWVDTTESDTDWYNYNTTDKKWANVKTADGSMWVWIPRYIYRISTDWHSSSTGTIDVQFSMDTDDTRDGTVTLNTGTTANASNNKWTNHPAFTFGTTELAGIWVAKFEASGTTTAIDFKPNVVSLRSAKIGDLFTATRNMEFNSRYGWGTSGTDIDTHLMKNSEWGAVSYLSKSTYGQNTNEIWINPADNYTTGCAGDSVSSGSTSGCLRTYETVNGVKASTTGTIYGIYDTSGGAWEYTSAYVNNAHDNLMTNGSSIMSADVKYKDIYIMGSSDTISFNYDANIKKGDAVYETSSTGENSTSWFGDYSYMPYTSSPWFVRGGDYDSTTGAGVFSFGSYNGLTHYIFSFRSVVLVGAGL